MALSVIKAAVVLWLLSPGAPPEQQQQSSKASIEGIVARIGSGEPIPGVEVMLGRVATAAPAATPAVDTATAFETTPLALIPSTVTDREGKFVFKGLDPGSYRLTAARNGYVKQEYGQRGSAGRGTVVTLVEGQARKDVAFSLTPAGNVSGHVRDYAGEPITGLRVQILRSAYDGSGKRALQAVGTTRTDDHGQYRLYWITPGRYYLNVGLGNPDQRAEGRSPNEVAPKPYPTTYYPGTLDPSKASILDVQPGIELSSIDLVLAEQDLYRIRGTVTDARTGKPPEGLEISIAPRQPDVSFGFSVLNQTYNPANGTFEFRNVAPGSYWLGATTGFNPDTPIAPNAALRTVADVFENLISSRPAAQTAIDISGSDLENVALTLTPGVSIRGRLRVEGEELPTLMGFERIHVELVPTTPNEHVQLPRPMQPDGSFSLDNVYFGEYRLRVNYPQQDVYVKEARFNSVDALNEPLLISGPTSETRNLDIVLSSKAGQIDGTLVDEKSRPLPGLQAVLVPDQSRHRIDLYKTAVTDQSGHFTIHGITPGEYKIFAWEAMEPFAYFDSDFVRQSEQKGKPVSISESSKITAEVKVIPATQ
jgi:protocatechuate 3,4-dioxygenase beta subunit